MADDPACMGLLQLIASLINKESSDEITDRILETHQHFDAKKIPKHSVRIINRQDATNICRAKFSLRVITSSPLAADILSQPRIADSLKVVWPGIWQWVVYLHERYVVNRVHGPIEAMDQISLTARVPIFVAVTEELRVIVAASPGLITLLGQRWLEEGLDEYYKSGRKDRPFTVGLQRLLQGDMQLYKEIAQMAKGGINTVARLAVQHLRAVLSEKPLDMMQIFCHLRLVVDLSQNPTFQLALLSNKLIPTIVSALALCGTHLEPIDASVVEQNVRSCYVLLRESLSSTNGLSWAIQAIEFGLFPALLKSGHWLAPDPKLVLRCSFFVAVVLYRYLIFRSVLRAVAKAFRKQDFCEISEDRTAIGPLWDAWVAFRKLAEERLRQKETFDERGESSKFAFTRCNRFECNKIDDETFRRCSGCLSAYYCSTMCQESDWPLHRESCKVGQQNLLTGAGRPLSRNDNSFIHSLVQHDIYTNLELVDELRLERKKAKPNSTDVTCLLVDYTAAPRAISLKTLDLSGDEGEGGAEEHLRLVREYPDDLILVQAWVQNGSSETKMPPSIMDLTGLREDRANELASGNPPVQLLT